MTSKDYQLIANVLFAEKANSLKSLSKAKYLELCKSFARFLANHNPRFNENRFLKACDVET